MHQLFSSSGAKTVVTAHGEHSGGNFQLRTLRRTNRRLNNVEEEQCGAIHQFDRGKTVPFNWNGADGSGCESVEDTPQLVFHFNDQV